MMKTWNVEVGASAPLGATVLPAGVNFSVFSKDARAIDLLLFEGPDATSASRVIPLDPGTHRTYHYWHAFVPDLRPGQVYAYRAHGPCDPALGMRFDGDKVLLDPYGLAVAFPANYRREAARMAGDNIEVAIKSVVADPAAYDWEDD